MPTKKNKTLPDDLDYDELDGPDPEDDEDDDFDDDDDDAEDLMQGGGLCKTDLGWCAHSSTDDEGCEGYCGGGPGCMCDDCVRYKRRHGRL